MIVDASAVVTVALSETDASILGALLFTPKPKAMSAVNCFEAALRLTRDGDFDLDALLALGNIAVVPATAEHARREPEAHRRFGEGRHPARLDMGDCFAYALAAEAGEALPCKGGDFARTDVAVVR